MQNTLTITKEYTKQVALIIKANNTYIKQTELIDTKTLNMFNIIYKEVIALKKLVEVPKNIKSSNSDYIYNTVSKALKEVNDNSYYQSTVTLAISYFKSGYSISFLHEIKITNIKRLLSVKPTKSKVKLCKTNKDLLELLDNIAVENLVATKKTNLANLTPHLKEILAKLSDEERVLLKKFYS